MTHPKANVEDYEEAWRKLNAIVNPEDDPNTFTSTETMREIMAWAEEQTTRARVEELESILSWQKHESNSLDQHKALKAKMERRLATLTKNSNDKEGSGGSNNGSV